MKLGKRLTQLEVMVMDGYDHIWDCCCDHGLLGAALLSRQAAPLIHFVDIVPELTHQLEQKLARFFPKNSEANFQWRVHCLDTAALPLQQCNGKHLIIIAGVGGELMAEFIRAIYLQNIDANIDFLLCPVNESFVLRQALIKFDFSLLTEKLIIENKRFYEVLLVSAAKSENDSREKINKVGSLIWKSDNEIQQKNTLDYLAKMLAHYRRVQLGSDVDVQHIIDAYAAITL